MRLETPAFDSHESQTRLRPVDAEDVAAVRVLDELSEDQLALGVNLMCLERALAEVSQGPRTAKTMAQIGAALSARFKELEGLRRALGELRRVALDQVYLRLFTADAPLADYVRGLYAWSLAATRALVELAVGVHADRPDWRLAEWRLEEASTFHFDELRGPIRRELALLGALSRHAPGDSAPMSRCLEPLFDAAMRLDEGLATPFL